MYKYVTNPAQIYSGPSARAAALLTKQRAPLILVHDGGGTNFNYHLLGPIDRPLWGIENARLHAGGYWEGGIAQMAEHYVGLLGKILPEGGDILLGGWSMGGLLSFEMAHQIALAGQKKGGSNSSSSSSSSSSAASSGTSTPAAPKFHVIGMIFIDTVFPLRLEELRGEIPMEPVILTSEQSKAMVLKDKVDLNMTHARMMVIKWEVPRWDGLKVPPTILMRAKEFVSDDPTKAFVDYVREYKLLGWDDYNKEHGDFIQSVMEVEGHHFSIFHMNNLASITMKVRDAADRLDPPEF
ncbi:alpha/beta-hydrolase [Rostrohypoxylon terebratum]|nr:alpha/beta-hydrolase [Rostrohypoxylon terebratum]